jgi:ComF family protein
MRILKKIIEIFFPSHCLSCEKIIAKDGLFCADCWPKLQFISEPKCKICSYPFEVEIADKATNLLCSNCAIKKPTYDKSITIFRYNRLIKKIIGDLKYRDQSFLAKKFSRILFDKAKNEILDCDFILAVPLHRQRLRKRKFNQAVLLAKSLLRFSLKIKFHADFLYRAKNTIPQVELRKKQRQRNLKNVFTVNKKYQNLVLGKSFLLIDDVMTTGATVENCALALKKLGAKKVTVLTIAKTIFGNAK